jgi:hypothetical protein
LAGLTHNLLRHVLETVRVLNHRFGEAAGEVLAQGPHRLGHLGEGGFGLRQLGLSVIKPQIKGVMELLAQGGPWFACTHLI